MCSGAYILKEIKKNIFATNKLLCYIKMKINMLGIIT